jgi:8-oxo-dGTP diphosphatase
MPRMGTERRNPAPTVDVIIEVEVGDGTSIVLIERKFEPHGWALPGGFVDYGEPLAVAARREALEEAGLEVELTELFHAYSDPARDARLHTISTVFLGRATGVPCGGDDAARAALFSLDALPAPIVFDHGLILADYARYRRDRLRPPPDR